MGGSERHAIIGADVGWQTAFFEQSRKDRKGQSFAGGGKRLADQQITAGMIGDGQWEAVVTIAEQ